MDVLLIQEDGVDLYATLVKSETSRGILRFYHPSRLDYGVLIRTASLGSSLSLLSEIRWYIRRYVEEVLFLTPDGTYCSLDLIQQVYERNIRLQAPWKHRSLYAIKDGRLVQSLPMEPGKERDDYADLLDGMDDVLEVWCTDPAGADD
jgi:hypothetical protein